MRRPRPEKQRGAQAPTVAPGVGAVMGQGPDPFLPTVRLHCTLPSLLVFSASSTFSNCQDHPQTFPAFSNSLHYLTFRSWLATWNDWTHVRHLDTCLSSRGPPASQPADASSASQPCPAAAHTLAQHQGNNPIFPACGRVTQTPC